MSTKTKLKMTEMVEFQTGEARDVYERVMDLMENVVGIPKDWLWVSTRWEGQTVYVHAITPMGMELGYTTVTNHNGRMSIFGERAGAFMNGELNALLTELSGQMEDERMSKALA